MLLRALIAREALFQGPLGCVLIPETGLVGRREFSQSGVAAKQKPFQTQNPWLKKAKRVTANMSEQDKFAAVSAVYGKHNPEAPKWVSERKAQEEADAKRNVLAFRGYPQKKRLVRSTATPITDAKNVLFETLEDMYESGWKKMFVDRQDWLFQEKRRAWAQREAFQEEKKEFLARQRLGRDEHWLQVKLERHMLKARIAAKNQIEYQKRVQIKKEARLEFLRALNEETAEFLRHPEECVNRRFVTFGYKRWMNWYN